jgi:endonuclease/exonuclease/phosphatase (EEP) superfamily protein YafD
MHLISLLLKLVVFLSMVAGFAPLAKDFVEPYFFLDLPSNFIVQWAFLSAFALLIFLYIGDALWIAICALLTIFHVLVIGLQFVPAAKTASLKAPTMKFLLATMSSSNYKSEPLARVLQEEDPDFITLLKIDIKWVNQLASLQRYYPYTYKFPLEGGAGMATFSKVPFSSSKVEFLGGNETPTLTNIISGKTGGITIISTQTTKPFSQEAYNERNSQLRKLVENVKETPYGTIIVGNLYTSTFAPAYKSIFEDFPFVNARQGFGIIPTWPMPFIPIAVPVDHVLVSPDFTVVDIHTTSSIESEHSPIVVKIASSMFPDIPASTLPR